MRLLSGAGHTEKDLQMKSSIYDFAHHTIQDPIHGSISFGPIEKRIIDHRLFQRLHGLRQNSLLHLVFPSANHTRFDHSLGVMSIAGQFFDAVINNQLKICSAGRRRKRYQAGYRVDDNNMLRLVVELDRQPYFKIVIRCAALFHDIGHGPLSHLFDKFFPTIKEVLGFLVDPCFAHLRPCLEIMKGQKASRPIPHEVLSCIIATRVLHDISDMLEDHGIRVEDIARDVCAAIGNEIVPSKRTTALPYNVATLLRDIISSDLDADRMDYLMRDSHMCGVNYGLYDRDRILKSMCAYATLTDRAVRAGVRYSSVGALEDLLIARYQMHAQIYGHKTNRACSAMLDAIQERLRESGWSWYKGCGSLQQLIDRFAELDDQKFIGELLDLKTNGHQVQVREIAEKLFLERRLVKRVFEERVPCTDKNAQREARAERRVNQHMCRLKRVGIWARKDVFSNKGPKIKSSKYSLKVLRKHFDRGWYEVHEVKAFSTVAHYLPEIEKTYRIYAKEKNVKKAKTLLPK